MAEPEELPESEYDGPWKDALDFGLELFLTDFEPEIHAYVDWALDYESLASELQRLFPAVEGKVRHADALFKLFKVTGDPLYLHMEVQAFFEALFGARTMTYRHRLRDWLQLPVLTVVVFADKNPEWCPRRHAEGQLDSEDICTWRAVKLLPWAAKLGELEAKPNVFCLFVAAHLEAMATRQDAVGRKVAKLRLLSNLLGRGLEPADTAEWYRLIDWLLRLPVARDKELLEELRQMQGEQAVKYMSFLERQGHEKGLKEGHTEGLKEGHTEGLKEGRTEGARRMLQAFLKVRFGEEGAALAAHLGGDVDPGRIESLGAAVMAAASVDELRPLFGNGTAADPPKG